MSQIHMGNGDHSLAESYRLVSALVESFSIVSGVQQTQVAYAFADINPEAERIEEDQWRLAQTACQIYTALTGLPISERETFAKMSGERKC